MNMKKVTLGNVVKEYEAGTTYEQIIRAYEPEKAEQIILVKVNGKLEELANQELESQKKCDEAIKGNREQVADIAMEALKGFMTCGLYFVPAMLKNLKLETLKGKNNSQLEEPINPDKITE